MPTSRRSAIALVAAVVFGVLALVVVPVVHHAWRRHENAASARDYSRAVAAERLVALPTSFAPTRLVGMAPCPTPDGAATVGRCWFTPAAPHQVTASLLAAVRAAGVTARLQPCEGGPRRRTGALAHFARTESCVVTATYGKWALRLSANTNLAIKGSLPLAPRAAGPLEADGSVVILRVVPS